MLRLHEVCAALRASRGFAHKSDIAPVLRQLAPAFAAEVAVGDDCAALPDGDGHLLFAIEGFVEDFVAQQPWFAGYCGILVNVSDIAAMGGRPLAVVDAMWSHDTNCAAALLAGMAEAARRYGVPIVGGHSNCRARQGQLAVAIVGRAQRLLTSFDARPGDTLLMAVDLRGRWQDPYPYWDASTQAPAERLRGDLELLPRIAEDGLCAAAKDISMAGVIGTALMLAEASGCGATIDLGAVPRPPGVDSADDRAFLRWLAAFPSYGFLLSVAPQRVAAVQERFHGRGLACAPIGLLHEAARLELRLGAERELLWDLGEHAFVQAQSPCDGSVATATAMTSGAAGR
jgi:AIR synthase-related protein